jgi:hypothetical protein
VLDGSLEPSQAETWTHETDGVGEFNTLQFYSITWIFQAKVTFR